MKISLIHPSRSRPEMAFETAKLWAANATNRKEIQYILAIDTTDPQYSLYENYYYHIRNLFGKTNISIEDNKNVVQAMNAGAKLSIGNIIIGISDDFLCPKNWDDFIFNNINIEKEEALRIDDGFQKHTTPILTLPILTKNLYNKLGFLYYPEYSGWNADRDLAEVCTKMGAYRVNTSLLFEHIHHRNKKRERDDTDNRHDSIEGAALGNKIFERRIKENFSI